MDAKREVLAKQNEESRNKPLYLSSVGFLFCLVWFGFLTKGTKAIKWGKR
jgi:hypothetical protein